MKQKILILFTIIFSFFPFFIVAETEEVFVHSDKVWIEPETIFSDQKTRIYTKFTNNGDKDLELIIGFYDNAKLIGEKKTYIISKGSSISWFDYKFQYGNHKIETKIKTQTEDTLNNKKKVTPSNTINLKEIKIDIDTDNDGIGDEEDLDDDGDGYPDKLEEDQGTNPKSKISTPQTKKITDSISNIIDKTSSVATTSYNFFEKKREEISNKISDLVIKEDEAVYNAQNDTENKITHNKTINNQEQNTNNQADNSNINLQIKNKPITYSEIKKNNTNNDPVESSIYLYILKIINFIFKSSFFTIIFILFISWLLWKLLIFLFFRKKNDRLLEDKWED